MIKVKNVGEAKRILRINGIKCTSSKYNPGPNDNSGTVTVDDVRDAQNLLGGYGLLSY